MSKTIGLNKKIINESGGWITIHPNGDENEYRRIYIDGHGIIQAGLGNKFNGKHLTDLDKKPTDKEKTPLEKQLKVSEAASNTAKSTDKAEDHIHAMSATDKAIDELSNDSNLDTDKKTQIRTHLSNVWQHHRAKMLEARKRGDMSGYEKFKNDAENLTKHATTSDDHIKAAKAHADAANILSMSNTEWSHHYNQNNFHLKKAASLKKAENRKAAKEAHKDSGGDILDKTFEKHTAEEINKHFSDNYGISFLNQINWKNKLKQHQKDKNIYNMTPDERDDYHKKRIAMMSSHFNSLGNRVTSHTPIDIEENTNSAKQMRKILGHVNNAFKKLKEKGYDLKGLEKDSKTTIASGTTGKSLGTSFQMGGVGYVTMNGAKNTPEYRAEQKKTAEIRKANNKPRWSMSSISNVSVETTAIHELAHAIGLQNHVNSPSKLYKIFETMFNGLKTDEDRKNWKEWITNNVSEYASTNLNEADAEIASMVLDDSYIKGTLPKELEEHVEWLFNYKGKRYK